jgi:uncharacterized membrane protein
MIQSIEQYLSQLKKELAGCDPATRQDALSDAEEYLRTALENEIKGTAKTGADALAGIIEKYGSPAEVAAAYRDIEDRLTPALAPVKPRVDVKEEPQKEQKSAAMRFFTVFADPVAWGSFIYLLFSLGLGIFYFTWAVTGLSLCAGLIVLIIGLPLLALFILSIRGLGLIEGRIVEALLGVRMPRRQPYTRGNTGWWQRFKAVFTDPYTWFSMIYMLLMLPLGITYFTILVTLISASLYGIALPILQFGYAIPAFNINGINYFFEVWLMPITVIGGILLLFITMNLARWLGRMHGNLAKTMLVRV